MSNPTLTCTEFADALADFLERDVAEATRAAMEAHALGCAECGPLLADLRRLRIDAANMPELAPSRDLWANIAARIETPVVDLGARSVTRNSQQVRRRVPRGVWLGLAAAGLIAVTATVTRELTRQSLATGGASTPAIPPVATTARLGSDSGASPAQRPDTARRETPATGSRTQGATRLALNASAKPSAEETYGGEIARLLVIFKQKEPQLDTATVAVVAKNIKIIDDAIAQCRLALRKDPASRFLMQSLNDALDTKVQLLRTAATLPSRT
ncbi:MAG TPA: zf-HC2 domain-containing protein [Gemmatimonadaceae bacterium]|nr:zf-HC2 domain-containing protein [Gemmatimonadaceae bacterium]